MQTVTVSGGKSDTTTAVANGFVLALNKGSVTFAFSASSVQATALLTGNGFVLTYQGLELLFERIAIGAPDWKSHKENGAQLLGAVSVSERFFSGGAGNRTPVRS